MKHLPNLVTLLNLSSGFIAIILATKGDVVSASWLILAAMLFDFLDGFTARLLNAYSEIGKELDSLADLVSFGVAPALIIMKLLEPALLEMETVGKGFSVYSTGLSIFIPLLMPLCAGLRLAKFNTDPAQAKAFRGLPTPANAIAVISLAIASHYTSMPLLKSLSVSPTFLITYSVIASLLMITHLPLLSLKFTNLKFKGNEGRYILAALVLILFVIFGLDSTILIIPIYIIISLATLFLFSRKIFFVII
jgi:CDP-diacylglycerol--serine O-phosphatidyltransferase